jgi:NADPH:quinone reductase-like Zn-dependent oxidoreductase
MTAHGCVFAAAPLQGKIVLVTGGAGAVGHYAVQLATWAGASVIATVSSEEKAARARAGDLQAQAAAEAEALRKEADVYVDFRIAAMEAGLQKTLSQIQTMRSRLETRSGLHAPETTVLPGGPSGTPPE